MNRQDMPYDKVQTAAGEVALPYDNRFHIDPASLDLQGDPTTDPLKPAVISYKKREGGVYIYSNNPEMLAQEDVGQALLRTPVLSGDVEFTYEHSNHSDGPIYLGFQLKNNGDTDAEILVTNAGIQVQGEWLGQQSWSDFYNLKFTLPKEYFAADGKETFGYVGQDFIDYTPRIFEPTTYRLPAGEYIYVLGGTTEDAFDRTNVADTADKAVLKGKCSNGVVKFRVTGGEIVGTFYAYNDAAQVQAEPKEQGHVVMRKDVLYGQQYKGLDPNLGLIEADITWTVNDKTPSGALPITLTSMYDEKAESYPKTPYMTYHSTPHTVNDVKWMTALNPQAFHGAVGTDMMVFRNIREDGTPIIIDNEHADGRGVPANTGNWMVQYNNNFTLVNQGDQPRTFRLYTDGALWGALFVLIRDRDGKVLETRCTIRPICYYDKLPDDADPAKYEEYERMYYPYMPDGRSYRLHKPEEALMATVTVQPHSVEQITVDYNILGNSCGSALNWATID